ncbi:hypothetical protein F4808DRAFT_462839 [Astrocystis sublimbata]|nr:hypothetical protein F4808DRAFT_462839 [Astrocystis sublimbata]
MSSFDPSALAFEPAKKRLKNILNDDDLFKKLSATTIEQVWETIKEVQKKPYAEQRMRHLGKIKSFLGKLEAYAATIDTFVQVKPDILALIWGPIRMLLVWTKNAAHFSDAVSAVFEKIGDALPHFIEVAKIFTDSEKLKEALSLFYGDILEFFVIVLVFFNMSRPRLISESIWPRRLEKIDVVVQHLEKHTALLRNEVSLQHIRAEHEARTKALEHFDQTTDFQQLQKFEAMRTQISPQTYYDRLDWLLNRSFNGSAEWLLKDTSFLGWLDTKSHAAPLLWFYGIPGAGKTFLAAVALKKARASHNALFVFASHMHQSSTTARSILQSLTFQLASEYKEAQAVVVESNTRELACSTDYVSELLKTLLAISGPIYIVIDGLDEIEAVERRILLHQLVGLASCPGIRILLSSRAEDDIAQILTTKATGIRVDERNSASIQKYVQQRYRDWIDQCDFDQEAQDKIQTLLAPIATRADGMFLYARIVLDNAEQLTSVEEIERELTVLPRDLNDAYGRIISKINGLPPALRRKARAILGWIGCTSTPMTRYELEQALLIDPASNLCPSVVSSVYFVRICGPILEIVDETPQFVHFTAKEYIFSSAIEGSIREIDARYELTTSILHYLSSDIFQLNISNEQLSADLVAGKYRLQSFASSQWVALVTRSGRDMQHDTSIHTELVDLIIQVLRKLKNDKFEHHETESDLVYHDLDWGDNDISEVISDTWRFRQDDRQTDWTFSNNSTWAVLNPLILSSVSVQTFQKLENLLCTGTKHADKCSCSALLKHYGTHIYRCIYPGCGMSRGFQSRAERNAHVKIHSRPWKCSVSSCFYADVGFSSKQDMYNHRDKEHSSPSRPVQIDLPLGKVSSDELELILLECTYAKRLDQMQKIMSRFSKNYLWSTWSALNLAAKMGSLEMVKILVGTNRLDEKTLFIYNVQAREFLRTIAQGSNVALWRWLLDAFASMDQASYNLAASYLLKTSSDDMYAAWEDFVLSPTCMVGADITEASYSLSPDDFRPAKTLIPLHYKRSILFSVSAFSATSRSAVHEERLVQTWGRLIATLGVPVLNPRFLGWSLTELGRSSKSIRLAKELLRLGAPIDFPRGKSGKIVANEWPPAPRTEVREKDYYERSKKVHRGRTSLHNAMLKTSEASAQLSRFLLEKGANPNYEYAGKRAGDEKGVTVVQKWLGETWDELTKRTNVVRLKRRVREMADSGSGDETGEPNAKRRRTSERGCKTRRAKVVMVISDDDDDDDDDNDDDDDDNDDSDYGVDVSWQ